MRVEPNKEQILLHCYIYCKSLALCEPVLIDLLISNTVKLGDICICLIWYVVVNFMEDGMCWKAV